jgi:hypothetical protein
MKLGTAYIHPLHSDDDHIVFKSSSLEDGTLLILTRLVYAPDGGDIVVAEDNVSEEAPEKDKENKTVTQADKKPEKTGK